MKYCYWESKIGGYWQIYTPVGQYLPWPWMFIGIAYD